ncbi:MAG: hypothetical protein WA996_07025 [Candidatus Promineifilaceae bacterium]
MPRTAEFNVQLANDLARLESYNKHLYRPNTYLHKWWARRCGTTFRLILKHLVAKEWQNGYYESGGLEGKVVLDPMMGGGTTLHEAIRLGANVIGFDLDPIPVIQAKASLSDTELPGLELAFTKLHIELHEILAPLFTACCPSCSRESKLRYMLYGQRRRCSCEDIIMVDSLLLREESDGRRICLCPTCHSVIEAGSQCDCSFVGSRPRLVVKGSRNCSHCGKPYQDRKDLPLFKRYAPLVKISDCSEHGMLFGSIDAHDRALLEKADGQRKYVRFDETLEVLEGPKSSVLIRKRIRTYADLFSSRQILYLRHAIDLLRKMDNPERRFLSLLVSTSLEFNSMLCGYKGASKRRAGAIRHSFSHHAYSFPHTALEANPVYPARTSGTLERLFYDRVQKARRWSLNPRERVLGAKSAKFQDIKGEIDQGEEVHEASELLVGQRRFLVRQISATKLPLDDGMVDLIVTDPPYYNSVQYADLSSFFRVWLKQMIGEEGESDIDWDYSLEGNPVPSQRTPSGRGRGERYLQIMSQIFLECQRVLRKDDGRLAFTFHHWDQLAWASLAKALKRARFGLVEFHIVHSENPISVHIANMRALTDDAILILAPSQSESSGSWIKPTEISYESSSHFSRDCATLLGWMLSSDLKESQIGQIWEQMLRVR